MKKLIYIIFFLAFLGGDCEVGKDKVIGTFTGKISGTITQDPPYNYVWRINSEALLTFTENKAKLTYKYVSSTQENKLKDGLPIYMTGNVILEGGRYAEHPDGIAAELKGTDELFTYTVGSTGTHTSDMKSLYLESTLRVKSEDKNTKTKVYIGKIGFISNEKTSFSKNKTYNLEYELSGHFDSPER